MTTPTASNTDRPRAKGYDLRIGSNYYRMAPSAQVPFIPATADVIPQRIATEQSAEEMGDRITRTVARSDFGGGQGLEFAHRRNAQESDATRYWDSSGIDFFPGDTIRESVRLHHRAEELGPSAASGGSAAEVYQRMVYLSDGPDVRRSNLEPQEQAVTWSSLVTGATNDLLSLKTHTDGKLYASEYLGDVYAYNGSSWSSLVTPAQTIARLGSAKERLFGASTQYMYEIDTVGGSTSTLYTTASNEHCVAIEDVGAYILFVHDLALTAAGGSVFRFYGDESGTLVQEGFVRIPDEVFGAAYGNGFLFYLARSGRGEKLVLWRAVVRSDASLGEITNLGEFDYGASGYKANVGADIRVSEHSVFFWTPGDDDNATIWRLDLATMGIHRHLDTPDPGATQNPSRHLVVIEGEPWFVTNLLASPYTTYVYRWHYLYYSTTDGYLILPLLDFFTSRDKEWLGITLWHAELGLVKDEEILVYYSTDPEAIADPSHGTWTLLQTVTSGTGATEYSLSGVQSRWLAVKLVLASDTDNQSVTPELFGVAVRAYTGSGATTYQLPINVSDQIERPNRRRLRVKGRGEAIYSTLTALEGTQQEVEIFRPARTITGVITRVAAPIMVMRDNGSSLQVAVVSVEGE